MYNWQRYFKDTATKIYNREKKLSRFVKIINFVENPYPFIKQSDLFVLTSKYEGLPNVLLEALTLKKFIISSSCVILDREKFY